MGAETSISFKVAVQTFCIHMTLTNMFYWHLFKKVIISQNKIIGWQEWRQKKKIALLRLYSRDMKHKHNNDNSRTKFKNLNW